MRVSIFWIIGIAVGIIAIGLVAWFFLFRTPTSSNVTVSQSTGGLGSATAQTTGTSGTASTGGTNQTTSIAGGNSSLRVFKIADGPVSGATFTQTFNPTTTLARYVLQENGHVMDQPIDIPGSLARAVSNTTIPGTQEVVWGKGGSVAYMQYLDGTAIKTVSLIFPAATSTRSVTRPVQIQFLPDNASAVAVSPAGDQVAYLLPSASGSDGYVSNIDGGNAKKLFSIGFSELLLSWPSQSALLLATKSAAGVSGMAFSVDVKTGSISPLIYASGLTAIADRAFANVVYRAETGGSPTSYLHSIKQGGDIPLSFDPIPEKCAWGNAATSTLYCAAPVQYVGANYLDLWHMGLASAADALVSFVPSLNGKTSAIAVPGSSDGGEQSDVLEMAVSADDKYLLFIKKGDRSLWGVRLSQ